MLAKLRENFAIVSLLGTLVFGIVVGAVKSTATLERVNTIQQEVLSENRGQNERLSDLELAQARLEGYLAAKAEGEIENADGD